MTLDIAQEIVSMYNYWKDMSCCCHCGNPPCSKCTDQPSEEEYNEALKYIEDYLRINQISEQADY